MIRKLIKKLINWIRRKKEDEEENEEIVSQDYQHSLFVPTYDVATQIITNWTKSWQLPNVLVFYGNKASHENAINRLNHSNQLRVIAFVGHGNVSELLTDMSIGKPSISIDHGCLMNCEDIIEELSGVHIIAWSCSSSQTFGRKIGSFPKCGFWGFNEEIVMLVNPESETLWSGLIKGVISRIMSKNHIHVDDKKWFRKEVSTVTRNIEDGEINTGSHEYNRLNSLFLRRIARSLEVHPR